MQELLESFAIRAVGVEGGGNVQCQQLLAVFKPGHSKKGIVEIQKAALGRGDEHAFLNAGHQRAVFLLRALAVGDVLQDMNSTELQSTRIGKCGVGGQEVAGQPRIGLVAFPADSFTVRATLVAGVLNGKKFRDASADKRVRLASQKLAQSLITAQDTPRAIVDQYRVAYGIKGVFPLTLNRGNLLKQAHVLKRQSEQICDVHKVR